jgi:hypothetical protein
MPMGNPSQIQELKTHPREKKIEPSTVLLSEPTLPEESPGIDRLQQTRSEHLDSPNIGSRVNPIIQNGSEYRIHSQ